MTYPVLEALAPKPMALLCREGHENYINRSRAIQLIIGPGGSGRYGPSGTVLSERVDANYGCRTRK
jgi:hypothetical protein